MLDFTVLSDDQLVELIRQACREAIGRSPMVEAAARTAALDEATNGVVAAEATAKEAERIAAREAECVANEAALRLRRQESARREQAEAERLRASWVKRAIVAKKVREALAAAGHGDKVAEGCQINVWRKNADGTGEKRVYLDFGRRSKLCLFVTGNGRTAPGAITGEGGDFDKMLEDMRPALQLAAENWGSIRLNCIDPNLLRYEEVQP